MWKYPKAVAKGQKIFDEAARNEAAREEMKKRCLELDRLRGGGELG